MGLESCTLSWKISMRLNLLFETWIRKRGSDSVLIIISSIHVAHHIFLFFLHHHHRSHRLILFSIALRYHRRSSDCATVGSSIVRRQHYPMVTVFHTYSMSNSPIYDHKQGTKSHKRPSQEGSGQSFKLFLFEHCPTSLSYVYIS